MADDLYTGIPQGNSQQPTLIAPPGSFADLYTAQEIEEDNFLAKASVLEPPRDLE